MTAQEELAKEAALYVDDPLGFVLDAWPWEPGEGPDEWQRQFLVDLAEEVRKRNFNPLRPEPKDPIRMAIASGHGIGKSTLMAMLFWWVIVTRPNAKIRVTANTYTQLASTTWPEIQKWGYRCRFRSSFEIGDGKIYHKAHKEQWFGMPITCAEENSEAFAGQHNRESTSAFFFDESSLIPDKIFEVADNGLTDGEPMWFAAGNPTRNTGKFYNACFGDWMHRWNQRSIDSRDCRFPNKEKIAQDILDHGIESDYVKTRIRGLPPAQSEAQLIGRDIVAGACKREVEALPDDPLIAGVDVPDGGSGWFVVRFRRGLDTRPGPIVPAPIRIAGSKTDRAQMIAICAEILSDDAKSRKLAAMFIDMGFGAAIVERLRALEYTNVFEIDFGGKSPDKGYANMRAFMWGKEMKDWLQRGGIDGEDKELVRQLIAPGFHNRLGGDGAIVVESKADMKKRGIASPDDGDALALTFARKVAPPAPKEKASRSDQSQGYNPFG